MSEQYSLDTVLQRKNEFNLAIPVQVIQQVNPFYKITVTPLRPELDPAKKDIYVSGRMPVRNGNREEYVDIYSLHWQFLNRVAINAGIDIPDSAVQIRKIDEDTWEAKAYGEMMLPDGSLARMSDIKIIDLKSEEKKFRFAYEEKAERGIEEYRQAKEAEKRYRGTWVDTGRTNPQNGYPIKKYVIEENEKQRYIERSLVDAMTQLRASAPQKAATGAKARVVRSLLGMPSSYTREELQKPFAVARMAFSPDYNDPMVKQMMLQRCLGSTASLFGTPVIQQTVALPATYNEPEEQEEVYEEPTTEEAEEYPPATSYQSAPSAQQVPAYQCMSCGAVIDQRVHEYSMNKFGRPLCRNCQRGARRQ